MTIAVIYGSSRPNSNTELLTEQIIKGLDVEKIYLKDFNIKPIIDMRHAEEGFQDRHDDYNSIIDRILPHDTLIFATPIYWYSMSGLMKNLIDRWSQTLKDQAYPDFKKQMARKVAYVAAVGDDEPYMKGLPLIQSFKYIFDFMGMGFGGYIIGKANRPDEIMQDKKALFAAAELNEQLKRLG